MAIVACCGEERMRWMVWMVWQRRSAGVPALDGAHLRQVMVVLGNHYNETGSKI